MYTNLWDKMNAFPRWNFLAQGVNKKEGRKGGREGKLEEILYCWLHNIPESSRKERKKEEIRKKETPKGDMKK